LPGWYQVKQLSGKHVLPNSSIPGIIVHVPPTESDLRPISTDELQGLMGESTRLTMVGSASSTAQNRSWVFLTLALMLVLLEALLIRR
jgi:hypothetical protein